MLKTTRWAARQTDWFALVKTGCVVERGVTLTTAINSHQRRVLSRCHLQATVSTAQKNSTVHGRPKINDDHHQDNFFSTCDNPIWTHMRICFAAAIVWSVYFQCGPLIVHHCAHLPAQRHVYFFLFLQNIYPIKQSKFIYFYGTLLCYF